MIDYGQLYNERFTKEAPRYTAGSQARTYQDYMRNIQMQRQNAGQTFGNLAQQQQNQSFYDRAMGRPQGLSGGMEQQYTNVTSAQRAQQTGQIAQQRFQAFSDIAQQEAQASQFARAQDIQEQQFQAQEIQLQQQRYTQAQQVMADPNLTAAQKQTQLVDLGLTYGEIDRMNAPTAGPIIGGAVTLGTTAAAKPVIGAVQTRLGAGKLNKIIEADPLLKNLQTNVKNANSEVTKATEALEKLQKKASSTPAQITEATKKLDKATQKVAQQKQAIKVAKKEMVDSIVTPPTAATQTAAQKAGVRIGKEFTEEVGEKAAKKAATKLSKSGTKLVAGGFKKTLGIAGGVLGAYFILDSVLMITTGQGVIGNIGSLVKGEGFAKGGLVGLANQ
jgi:hypothetical protein